MAAFGRGPIDDIMLQFSGNYAITRVMEFDVLTLFPETIEAYFSHGVLARARKQGLFELNYEQIRDHVDRDYKSVDDQPYGGGAGQVMKCEPLYKAWHAAKYRHPNRTAPTTIMFTPTGKPFTQADAQALAKPDARYILVCGRYEGIDERFSDLCVDLEYSVGDFVLSGGEIAAMAFIDSVARLLPGALGNFESTHEESFSDGFLEYPQYTRPEVFAGKQVPEVLLSGDHKKIAQWRREQAFRRTKERRPDLIKKVPSA